MNTKINTDRKNLIYEDLSYAVRGAVVNVYNELGYGHKEQVYQKALAKEFEGQSIPFEKEVALSVSYKGVKVGSYRPDFVVGKKIIIELKAVEFMPKTFETQLINYLKATNYQLGILVNFGSPKLYIRRLINSYPRKSVNISENHLPPMAAGRR